MKRILLTLCLASLIGHGVKVTAKLTAKAGKGAAAVVACFCK